MFLGNTQFSTHIASLHPVVQMRTGKFKAKETNPEME